MTLHVELERRLAQFKGAEAVITLQSGFTANLAAIPALVGKGDIIFSDALNHASIIDGCRLSRATIVGYAHNDVDDLRRRIAETTEYGRRLIISDGVFSMDGDIAPLPALVEIAQQHGIMTMVDDAHGEGVLGKGGRGIVDTSACTVRSMSKSHDVEGVRVVGGIVAGKQVIVDWLRQRAAHSCSVAMTVPDAAACLEAVDRWRVRDLVKRLWANAAFLKEQLRAMGFDTGKSETPIIPLMLGEAELAQRFSRALFEQGVFAMPIGFPTVAKGAARIRVMNTAAHSQSDLESALAAFETVGKSLGVIYRQRVNGI